MSKFISPGDIEGKLERKQNIFLSLLRKYPGISRQECAKRMRVSTFNITKLTPELIKKGMVIEDEPSLGETASRGRPLLPLRLNPDYEYFAGIDIEASQWRFAIVDFSGNIVHSKIEPFMACASREDYIELLGNLLRKNISESGRHWGKVSGLGIGSPGFLEGRTGVVENYEILPEFKNIPILDIYDKISGKNAFIINNVCNLAIYDLWKRPDSHKVILHLALRSGISGALTINGNVYRGNDARAGEAGLIFIQDNGFLQEISGLSALKKKLPGLPDEFWHGSAEIIEKECRKKKTRETMDNAISILASAIAGIAAFLDPGEIIVYSTLFSEQNQLWEKLRDEFKSCRKKQQLNPANLRNSGKAELNAAAGAAYFAMESIYQI